MEVIIEEIEHFIESMPDNVQGNQLEALLLADVFRDSMRRLLEDYKEEGKAIELKARGYANGCIFSENGDILEEIPQNKALAFHFYMLAQDRGVDCTQQLRILNRVLGGRLPSMYDYNMLQK